MSGNQSTRALFQEAIEEGKDQAREGGLQKNAEYFRGQGGLGNVLTAKRSSVTLASFGPFGMEGAEVDLERGQERAELVEMGERRHENGERKDVCCGAGMGNEMNKATPDGLVLPARSLLLRNSPKPLNQRE